MRVMTCLLLLFVTFGKVWAQEPVKTDSDKYQVVFENERVRVLEYRDKPGDKTTMHAHPDFVVVTRSAFKRRLTLPDGKSAMREFKAGEVMWQPAQSHIGENIGDTDTEVLIIELKEPRPPQSGGTKPQ
ncbi:MAG TPA: cytoplasmic protein [Candidatus Binatia bacterium]|nr:cytoplasmic protein [Candidatus Binatia bacterium]